MAIHLSGESQSMGSQKNQTRLGSYTTTNLYRAGEDWLFFQAPSFPTGLQPSRGQETTSSPSPVSGHSTKAGPRLSHLSSPAPRGALL